MKRFIASLFAIIAALFMGLSAPAAVAQPGYYAPRYHRPPPPPPRYHRPPPPPRHYHRPPPPPPPRYRSWCDYPRGYYPAVRHCPSGWHRVPVRRGPPPPPRRYY
ncbi:MAG TPA: hypothetical protein DEO49_06410 [Sutterella sp.]|nr:hypothetical protein [Sutterella sp.]